MSENKKNTTPVELISEEQLDAVAGGARQPGDYGTIDCPIKDENCWFVADGEMREDGRTRCKTQCKGMFDGGSPVKLNIFYNPHDWYTCHCFGTDSCVEKMHRPCGRPLRTNW